MACHKALKICIPARSLSIKKISLCISLKYIDYIIYQYLSSCLFCFSLTYFSFCHLSFFLTIFLSFSPSFSFSVFSIFPLSVISKIMLIVLLYFLSFTDNMMLRRHANYSWWLVTIFAIWNKVILSLHIAVYQKKLYRYEWISWSQCENFLIFLICFSMSKFDD